MKYSVAGIVLAAAVLIAGCVSVTPVYYKDDKAVAIKAVERVTFSMMENPKRSSECLYARLKRIPVNGNGS